MANQVDPLLTLPQLSIGYQILLNYGLLRWALFYKFTNLSCKSLDDKLALYYNRY